MISLQWYSLGFFYLFIFCQLHNMILDDSFQVLNTLMYLICVHHQFRHVPIFTVAWSLLLPFPVWRYWCDIRHCRDNKNQLLVAAYTGLMMLKSEFYTKSIWWHTTQKRGGQSLLAEPVVWSLIHSCILCFSSSTLQSPDTASLTLLCASDSSDRPATEIDVAQLENRGRMAIMSS